MKKTPKWLSIALAVLVLLLGGANVPGLLRDAPAQETASAVSTDSYVHLETAPQAEAAPQEADPDVETITFVITEDGRYTSKEEVAAYINAFGHLPDNFITKARAQDLGWENKLGNLNKVAPGMSIGGDYFGNYEGLLPKAKGRKYYECDIDFDGRYRNAKRIIFSNDGLIYYTEDHYETFELMYGEE